MLPVLLPKLSSFFPMQEKNVEYAYAFLTPEEGHAYVIFRVDNNEKACEHLKENGVDVIEENSLL